MDYQAEIECFIEETQPRDGRVKKRLIMCMEILAVHGIETPTERDYKEVLIPVLIERDMSRKTAGGYVTAMRKFERWHAQQKGDDREMPTETVSIQTQTEAKPDSEAKRGKRDRVQVSTYISPDDYEALKALAVMSRSDMSAVIAQAIGGLIGRNEALLSRYEALMKETGTLNV